ncbi:hypothetical protein HHI36_021184 [Cryptolaemus montrouzieri]|uniref:Uncharacterized protein n=1 Tax=Cryptolaemus montrouzieri TaxID=559131 RepID=A0ABD2MWD3_9CUCU
MKLGNASKKCVRATLAEKEVTTLKEQISNNTTNNSDNTEGNNMDRHSFENELIAKEKEVRINLSPSLR